MEIIIIITTLIAGISIYDYLSARRWAQVTSDERNETVFANRNRAYGAYQMRTGYNIRLLIIMGSMIFAIGVTYAVFYIVKEIGKQPVEEPKLDLTQFSMDAPKIDEPLDPPKEEPVPPMEKTIQFLPPVVMDNAEEDKIPPQEAMEDVRASTETNNEENDEFIPPKPPEEPVAAPVVKEEIFTYVEEEAEFPGGMTALKTYLRDNIKYPQTAVELEISGRVFLTFVVSASGNISNVNVKRGIPDCPECDAEAVRVVRNMPKWKPGKNGGKAVPQYYNLPVNFTLQ